MTDLHVRLLAEIERREAVAKAATSGQWARDAGEVYALRKPPLSTHVADVPDKEDAAFIALHDPADALRGYAEDRDVLARHAPLNERPYRKTKCRHEHGAGVSWMVDWPCPEVLSVARRLGVDP